MTPEYIPMEIAFFRGRELGPVWMTTVEAVEVYRRSDPRPGLSPKGERRWKSPYRLDMAELACHSSHLRLILRRIDLLIRPVTSNTTRSQILVTRSAHRSRLWETHMSQVARSKLLGSCTMRLISSR